ncbi:MAG: hypothetical protein E7079_08065 [Bacteroidales bacterium]|nr:hypothetical protein [Bacteroidales bacterium]
MKKFAMSMMCGLLAFIAMAQTRTFEESQSRIAEPELKIYIRPMVADLEVLNNQKRMKFGPYKYEVNAKVVTEDDLVNLKATSVYKAAQSSDADVIVGAIFNTYIEDSAPNVVNIEVIGFPAKYVNFRPLGTDEKSDDYDMIRVVYPPTGKQYEESAKTQAIN